MTTLLREWKGAVVLVTGGSRGIGQAACWAFAGAGATVYTCATSKEGLRATVDGSPPAGAVIARECDVTHPTSVADLFDEIRREAGRLDVLVNNAGVLGPKKRIEDVDYIDWKHTLDVNLNGTFLTARASIPLLAECERSCIVNLSSSVGRVGRAEWGPYSVSKFGVEGLTEVLADELKEAGTVVCSLNPGGTATDMRAEAYPDEDPETLPSPAEVAQTILFLADRLDVGESGKKYNSRDLFDVLSMDEVPAASDFPSA